jgi:Big-like domain-containing protein
VVSDIAESRMRMRRHVLIAAITIAFFVVHAGHLLAGPGGAKPRRKVHGTRLTSSVSPSLYGQPVTFTATVTNLPPIGASKKQARTVVFKDGATILSTNVLNDSGVATFTTASLSVGSHSITVAYMGHPNFGQGVSATVNQAVNAQVLEIQSLEMLSDRTAKISCSGAPGAIYSIQASTDLGSHSWTTIATNLADNAGHFTFIDPDAPNYTSRFYRLAAD